MRRMRSGSRPCTLSTFLGARQLPYSLPHAHQGSEERRSEPGDGPIGQPRGGHGEACAHLWGRPLCARGQRQGGRAAQRGARGGHLWFQCGLRDGAHREEACLEEGSPPRLG
ncbi:hypothetical protein T484DRAFT_1922960 [Baffinella frigidus]|nr:hypothetical protein T484DRAFT_1922960 [Cryptophyta sp. CCMP2293]